MKTGFLTGRDAATKLSAIVIAMVFFCLIVLQAFVFWKSWQQVEKPATTALIPVHKANDDMANIGRLAATHLFGDVENTVLQGSEVKEDKSLNLTLRGIVANSAGSTSLAIIESKPDGEETFAPGDTVFNKGQLNSVAVDHVILQRSDGRLVRLQLPEQEIDSGNENDPPQSQPAYVEPETPAPEQNSDNNPTPEPAAAVQAEPEPQPEPQNQTETQPEISPKTTPDESTGDNQGATPDQP